MPIRSKKDLASDELEQALSHVGKALSLLGGRTRALSVRNNTRVFTVRKYLESIENRLQVCQDLLQLSATPEGRNTMTPEPATDHHPASELVKLFPDLKKVPRDDFEREYDATREVGC